MKDDQLLQLRLKGHSLKVQLSIIMQIGHLSVGDSDNIEEAGLLSYHSCILDCFQFMGLCEAARIMKKVSRLQLCIVNYDTSQSSSNSHQVVMMTIFETPNRKTLNLFKNHDSYQQNNYSKWLCRKLLCSCEQGLFFLKSLQLIFQLMFN